MAVGLPARRGKTGRASGSGSVQHRRSERRAQHVKVVQVSNRRWVTHRVRSAARLLGVLVLAVCIGAAVRSQVFFGVRVSGSSMLPTFSDGRLLLVRRCFPATCRGRSGAALVKRGRVAVFDADGIASFGGERSLRLLKRVVALSGDTVAQLGRRIYVNGRVLEENDAAIQAHPPPALVPPWVDRARAWGPTVVGLDSVFVLSDNRSLFRDSREFGPIPVAWVTGVVSASIWPPSTVR